MLESLITILLSLPGIGMILFSYWFDDDEEDYAATKIYFKVMGILLIVFAVSASGNIYVRKQIETNMETMSAIIEEHTNMETTIKNSVSDGEYRYIVDGVELETIDDRTISNYDAYNIVIDEKTKTIVMTSE